MRGKAGCVFTGFSENGSNWLETGLHIFRKT